MYISILRTGESRYFLRSDFSFLGILFIVFYSYNVLGQENKDKSIGIDIGYYSSSNALFFNVAYFNYKNGYSIGMTRELNFPIGKLVED